VFILTSICAVKKIFRRPTDPNFLAYVTGNIYLFLGPTDVELKNGRYWHDHSNPETVLKVDKERWGGYGLANL
jgi:hypothetical protein